MNGGGPRDYSDTFLVAAVKVNPRLGRKWTLLILRGIGFFGRVRFNEVLKNNPGLGPRILSIRLRELQDEEFIVGDPDPEDRRGVCYRLAKKGLDAMILTAFIQFGIRHHSNLVFDDGIPRALNQGYPRERSRLLGQLYEYARERPGERPSGPPSGPRK